MNDPARHIGIAAVSAEGASLCYRTVCIEGASLLGRHDHPEVTLHNHSLAEYMRHIDANRWDEAGRLLLDSANKLVQAGAEILICRTERSASGSIPSSSTSWSAASSRSNRDDTCMT